MMAEHAQRFNEAFAGGRYEEALEHIASLLELNPNEYTYYLAEGTTYLQQSRYMAAISSYSKAIRCQPEQGSLLLHRATAFLYIENFIEALNDVDKAIQFGCPQELVYEVRGSALFGVTLFQRSAADFRRAILLQPNDAKLKLRLAQALLRINNSEGAQAAFIAAFEASNTDLTSGFLQEGDHYLTLGLFDIALRCYVWAISTNSNIGQCYFRKAKVLVEMERDHDALADMNVALQYPGREVEKYCFRGDIRRKLNSYQLASMDYQHALRLEPQNQSIMNKYNQCSVLCRD